MNKNIPNKYSSKGIVVKIIGKRRENIGYKTSNLCVFVLV
jgi:hypothetical protein